MEKNGNINKIEDEASKVARIKVEEKEYEMTLLNLSLGLSKACGIYEPLL